MPFVAFYHTHKLVVVLFILIYLTKAILLLMGNKDALNKFNSKVKIPEMVVSALLFITGIIMLNNIADFNLIFTIKLTIVVAAIPVAVIAYKKYNKLLAVLALISMGLVTLSLTSEPLKAGMGLLTFLTGVDLFYSAVEQSVFMLTIMSGRISNSRPANKLKGYRLCPKIY